MPQPIHFRERIDFNFLPGQILKRRTLAVHIALISALWNEIEARISAFLASLVGEEGKTIIAIYLAITNDGAKRAALDAIVSSKLSPAENLRFQKIMKTIGSRYRDRNTVIHGGWGTSSKFPGKLLWSDIRDTIPFQLDMKTATSSEHAAHVLSIQRKFMVYGLSDFKMIEQRISAAYDELRDFTKPLMERGLGPHARVDWRPPRPRRKIKVLPDRTAH